MVVLRVSDEYLANPCMLAGQGSRTFRAGVQPLGMNAMTAVPTTLLSAAATVLAVLFVFYTGFQVGRMRGKHKIAAPAVTGHPEFECAYRVQVNTLEQFVVFLPLLWLATLYFQMLPWLPAVFGLVWIIGRLIYMQGYMAAPDKRGTGFGITMLASLGLLIMSVIGIVEAWTAVHAS
jgi:glutathione S-transferase